MVLRLFLLLSIVRLQSQNQLGCFTRVQSRINWPRYDYEIRHHEPNLIYPSAFILHPFEIMSSQFFAWLTAFSFACANVTVGHGMRYSTPLTATFVSLVVHTTVLWTALFFTSGIPAINDKSAWHPRHGFDRERHRGQLVEA
jgi:hypothetical protein